MPAYVVVRDLRKRYGIVEAVSGVTFAVERGEIFGLLGPNGAGKTTTLDCLVGLREPDGGELSIGGLDVRREPRAVKEKIGAAFAGAALPEQITPREALRLFGAFYREHEEPATLLARFALDEKADARFGTLSTGQRQRLALALAFVNRPELVVLDEPAAGLDPWARNELHASIAEMKRGGCTVLLATHDLDEAEKLCDRVAIIDRGRIVTVGAPRDLAGSSSARATVRFVTAKPLARAKLEQLPHVETVHDEGAAMVLSSVNVNVTLGALTALVASEQSELLELHVQKASLESVLLSLAATDKKGGGG